LDLIGGSTEPGTKAELLSCNDSNQTQKWIYYADETLRPQTDSTVCLDNTTYLNKCNNTPQQKWKIDYVPDATYPPLIGGDFTSLYPKNNCVQVTKSSNPTYYNKIFKNSTQFLGDDMCMDISGNQLVTNVCNNTTTTQRWRTERNNLLDDRKAFIRNDPPNITTNGSGFVSLVDFYPIQIDPNDKILKVKPRNDIINDIKTKNNPNIGLLSNFTYNTDGTITPSYYPNYCLDVDNNKSIFINCCNQLPTQSWTILDNYIPKNI
jgi:hypothetical protein